MITLVLVRSEEAQKELARAIKRAKGAQRVVVFPQPFGLIKSMLKKEKVDVSDVVFISSAEGDVEENTFTIQRGNLSALSITIEQVLQALSGKRVLIFYSPNSLELDNSGVAVGRFVLFLSECLRQWGVEGVWILPVSAASQTVLGVLEQASDVVVNKAKGKGR